MEEKHTALITGASGDIGAACARALHRAGMRVVLGYNSSGARAEALAEELGCDAFRVDVSDSRSVDELFSIAGAVDVLVTAAGIACDGLASDITDDMWRRVFAVNCDGTFYCCRRAIPRMLRSGWGRIITVSSIWGMVGAGMESAYSASKAAVIGFSKALAKELGPSGITVNCVAPGVIDTRMNAYHSEETMDGLRLETPVQRLGTPDDVAAAVAFLASEEASFITGQVISPNGGFVI